jgi:hypothetical protein
MDAISTPSSLDVEFPDDYTAVVEPCPLDGQIYDRTSFSFTCLSVGSTLDCCIFDADLWQQSNLKR